MCTAVLDYYDEHTDHQAEEDLDIDQVHQGINFTRVCVPAHV